MHSQFSTEFNPFQVSYQLSYHGPVKILTPKESIFPLNLTLQVSKQYQRTACLITK